MQELRVSRKLATAMLHIQTIAGRLRRDSSTFKMHTMKIQFVLGAFMLMTASYAASAQHHPHTMTDMSTGHQHADTTAPADHMQHMNHMEHMNHMGHMQMDEVPMTHAYSLHLPMSRDGSGTAWLPDASPTYGLMFHSRKWMYMVHGNIALRYTHHDLGDKGSRGGDDLDAPNWFMGMAQRKLGSRGLLHLNAMLSLDRLTEGGAGYPLLFQSGESWKGVPLVDRQHPHDLFAALSAAYTYSLSPRSDLTLYVAYPGEPALGSVAFMHRPSALADPDAPISHHWNDGTHITFGVATLGYRYGKFRLEASSFTGKEPDEERYGFDKPRFDSWSGRLSFNPSDNWAFQVSRGWIESPEALHPGEDVTRTTASAIYSRPFGDEKFLDATGIWGLNKSPHHEGENALLLEGRLRLQRLAVYTRYEWVQKSSEELALDENTYGEHTLFDIHALTLGAHYDLFHMGRIRVAGGGQLTGYAADHRLDALYGRHPLSGELFLRIYPGLLKMKM